MRILAVLLAVFICQTSFAETYERAFLGGKVIVLEKGELKQTNITKEDLDEFKSFLEDFKSISRGSALCRGSFNDLNTCDIREGEREFQNLKGEIDRLKRDNQKLQDSFKELQRELNALKNKVR